MTAITFQSIGVIHTPFTDKKNMPIQPKGGTDIRATVEVFEPYCDALADLDGFSHVILLYYLHQSSGYNLRVVPFLDTEERGLFATRAPRRPNPIGLSVVQLNSIDNSILHIQNIDILDGTPLLDIKPYVPEFDSPADIRLGWLEHVSKNAGRHRSDNRFD